MEPLVWTFAGLLVGHGLADVLLQPRWIGLSKHRSDAPNTWLVLLGLHGLAHGVVVGLITQSFWLGLAETIAHASIDFGRGERWYSGWVDQGLHVATKTLWIAVLFLAGT